MLIYFYLPVICRLNGVATRRILIIRNFREQLLFLSVAGDVELQEESSESLKWLDFNAYLLFSICHNLLVWNLFVCENKSKCSLCIYIYLGGKRDRSS